MKEGTKKRTTKRCAVTVYFESAEQLENLERASGGNLSGYIRDRVLFDEGYADPRHEIARELLSLARGLHSELHLIGDLVRAMTRLRDELERRSDCSQTPAIHRLLDKADETIHALLAGREQRVDDDHALIRAIKAYSLACARWEVNQMRVATRRNRRRLTP